ncbi:MAG TPA: penicillin acylase family protein [Bryobacteraceae bacterium]|nr:penicillin acylase family protein [Bryobacteraceae bacterium]
MRRLLVAVNILIAILVVTAAAVFYEVFWRALPETSGTVATFVSQPVEVDRDRLGVPHIKARTLDDAWFVLGYVTAEDRMFQMDGLRRVAGGDLAEIVGPGALESDLESRKLRMRRMAEQSYTQMSPEDKAVMEAYARGVNAYLETHRGRYGFEFAVLGYDPRPWSVVDSLLAGLQMFRTLTNDWKYKMVKHRMLAGGEPDKIAFLFPNRAGTEFMPGGDVHPGSNAWAIAGSRSASGKPLVSNDMHLEFAVPGVWYLAHIEAPGMNVTGVSLPGVPGIVSGHNDRIAWGMTNLGFDVQDLYMEKIDLRTGQYLYQGKMEQARQEREVIAVRGQAPEELMLWVTRHGPVFDVEQGMPLAIKWTAGQPGVLQNVFPEVNRARNWEEFRRAISRFGGPGQNFVYGDVDGNIGYLAAGKLPIRRNYYGDVPVDGSSGQYEWDGYIPFDELPHAFNPANGLVVTANQSPFPPDYRYHVSGFFDSPYRSQQIFDLLAAGGTKLRPEDSLRVQKDVYSAQHEFLAQRIVAAYDKHGSSGAAFADAAAILRKWDGQMDRDSPAPLIVTLAYQHLRTAIADRASPGNGKTYDLRISAAVVERLIRQRPAGWFGDYDELLLRSFADGIEEGQRMQGKDVKRWKWGKYMYREVDHPVGSRLPLVAGYFDIGPEPMSGGPTTVKQTSLRIGPSERMDASLGDLDASLMEIPIGESGHVASAHYRDQWDAYYNGRSFPMQFHHVDAKSTVTFVPQH